jgi:hypothetical protein
MSPEDAMSFHVWIRPLDGFGEECIDLATCRRFECTVMGRDADHDLVYYEAAGPRWIRYSRYPDSGGDDESYAEVHGQEVAFELLQVPRFGGRLTRELSPFRKYGDLDEYQRWRSGVRDESGQHDRPRWDADAGVFYIGDEAFREVATQAKNQRPILDALEKAGWLPHAVRVNIDDENKLYEAVREMNEWLAPTPFRISREGRKVRWERRR